MNRDLGSGDILQDPLIGCRLAPLVMFRLQAIDGNHDIQTRQRIPMQRNLAEGAGHKLHVNATPLQLGQQFLQLAITHQRVASHQRHMQRAMLVDQAEGSLHQVAALEVRQLTERDAWNAQMRVFIGIAARTAQRTLARKLDGDRGSPARIKCCPMPEKLQKFSRVPRFVLYIGR